MLIRQLGEGEGYQQRDTHTVFLDATTSTSELRIPVSTVMVFVFGQSFLVLF